MIEQSIQELIQYGIAKELVTEEDSIFLRNQLNLPVSVNISQVIRQIFTFCSFL